MLPESAIPKPAPDTEQAESVDESAERESPNKDDVGAKKSSALPILQIAVGGAALAILLAVVLLVVKKKKGEKK